MGIGQADILIQGLYSLFSSPLIIFKKHAFIAQIQTSTILFSGKIRLLKSLIEEGCRPDYHTSRRFSYK